MTARKKVTMARTSLVLDQPFFGALALRLAMKEDPTCKTAWVDGRTLGYNPEFVEDLTHAELVGLIAHEVMHCAAGHPWRRDAREHRRWNHACDRTINPMLRDSGFALPEGALYEIDPSHHGKSSEWVYDRLPPDPDGDGSGAGDDGGAGDPLGEVRDAPAEADAEGNSEADWQQAVQQAAQAAKARGSLSGDLERAAKAVAEARVDWRSVLRRFVQQVARADYSWTRPNPRYLARGLYLPALRSEEMGPVVVAIDTSGSIDAVLLDQFGGELRAIAEDLRPERVHVIYCDSAVRRIDTFERGEPIELHPAGGGGTAFSPVFEAVDDLEDVPSCVVYLTDLDGTFPESAPPMPVLWASTSGPDDEVPFGEVVPVQ
jgi:predicted metal-dependent peptidase